MTDMGWAREDPEPIEILTCEVCGGYPAEYQDGTYICNECLEEAMLMAEDSDEADEELDVEDYSIAREVKEQVLEDEGFEGTPI